MQCKPFYPLLRLLLATSMLGGCSYTSQEEMIQKRFAESSYVVYWENRESGFQSKLKGIYDYQTAVEQAEEKKLQRPENRYWVEQAIIDDTP